MSDRSVKIQAVKGYQGKSSAIFEIELPNRQPVYMSVKDVIDNEAGIVIVDAQKFLVLWRKTPVYREEANGNTHTWILDKKYPDAEEGFSRGISSPVPLAKVSCSLLPNSVESYVSVANVTRTIWLLANGCRAFPVLCEPSENPMDLYRMASVSGIPYFTYENLLNSLPICGNPNIHATNFQI